MELTTERFFLLLVVFFILNWLFDNLSNYLVVRHGWMWLRHGGALGEIQKQEHEEYLTSVWRYRD